MLHEVRLPGTNIEVLISSNIIEIRDEDFLQSIEYSGKKYEDVIEEIQRLMHKRGWDITKRVIKFVLDQLGLPKVDYFPEGELSQDENPDLSDMLANVKELLGVETGLEISADSGDKLNFKFHAENIPKEADSSQRSPKSEGSSFDWEEAPSVGSE